MSLYLSRLAFCVCYYCFLLYSYANCLFSLSKSESLCLPVPLPPISFSDLELSRTIPPAHKVPNYTQLGKESKSLPLPLYREVGDSEDKTTFPTHWVDQQGLNPGLGTMLGIRQLIIVSTITLTSESHIFGQCLLSLLTASVPSLPLLPL